jgi:hypothetical protein
MKNIDIQKIKLDIEKAEKKEKLFKSKQEIINELKPHINILREKGYSFADIVKFLFDRGIGISEGTLKSYLNKNNDKDDKTKNKNKNKFNSNIKKSKIIQQDIIDTLDK